MRTQFRLFRWGGTLLLTSAIAMGGLMAGTRAVMAAQNPVNLDEALQEKVGQDRAQSYYHFSLSKWYDLDGNLPRALTEMQAAVRYDENEATLHVGLADILARMGRMPDATEEAQRAARLDPKDPEPHWLLATIYLRSADRSRGRQGTLDAINQAIKELEAMKLAAPNDQRAYFALGGCYMESGQPDKGIAAYERWQSLVPDSDQGYLTIAQYYQGQGNNDKAIEYLQKALEAQPDSVQSLSLLAGIYAKGKREEDAVPLYRKILAVTGGSPDVKRQLATSLLDLGEFTEAAGMLGELSEEYPQDEALLVLTGRAQLGARKYEDAIATLKSAAAGAPDNIEARFYLGAAYEEGGQPAEGAKIFSALVDQAENGSEELKANKAVFQQHLANCYDRMGDSQKAIGVFEKMVQDDPSPRSNFALINAYRIDRQFDKALDLGKRQYEKNPKDATLGLVYARTLADAGRTKDGIDIVNKLIQADPENLDLYVNLSQIYIQAGRFSDAEKILELAGDRKLDERRVKFQLASVYERAKEFDRAESLFRDILKEDPEDATTLNYLGYMLADRGVRLDEAVGYVKQALAQEPNNGAYLDSLGWAYFKMNQMDNAEKYLLQAVELEKRDPVIHDHLGDVYFKTGAYEKAQECWKKSLDNGGEPDDVLKVRAKLEKVQEILRKQKRHE